MADGLDRAAGAADPIAARLASLAEARETADHPNIRPSDAATVLILDRAAGGPWRVLMGRRHQRHRFYPGAYVFPGGRVDPEDARVPLAAAYHPDVAAKLVKTLRGAYAAARARAFGVAAVRETYEEAGLFIGAPPPAPLRPGKGDWARFHERGLAPSLAPLRFVARAITPPRRTRRFDTRFLACFGADIADRLAEGVGPSGELEDVAWLTFAEAKAARIPHITAAVLDEIADLLAADPALRPPPAVPFYRHKAGRFIRDLL
jgi:8-oxo-dGTP pyrophosphatase MutT (NUDIX family)